MIRQLLEQILAKLEEIRVLLQQANDRELEEANLFKRVLVIWERYLRRKNN